MDRKSRVDAVYASVKDITDPDAFQHVLEHEPDKYVLADLRDRFWSGSPPKPWQVKEINRLLTKRGASEPTRVADEDANVQVARISARQAILVALITVAGGVLGALLQRAASSSSISDSLVLRDSIRQLEHTVTDLRSQLSRPRQWLHIDGVAFNRRGAQVRLFALVEGTVYTFPTASAWADGDDFRPDSLPLAGAGANQRVRFYARFALPNAGVRDAGSAEVLTTPSVPYSGDYRLYESGSTSGAGAMVARVQFAIR